jgi:hypothetical protein
MRRDAASRAQSGAFGEFRPDFRDRPGCFECLAKWIGASGLERSQFFAPLRDELIFVFHPGRANLERSPEMNSL